MNLRTIVLLSIVTVMPVTAATLVFETGFEPPDYSLGILAGQDGWTDVSQDFDVQNSVVKSGTQAAGLDVGDLFSATATHTFAYDDSNTRLSLTVDFRTDKSARHTAGILLGNSDRILGVIETIGAVGSAIIMSDGSGNTGVPKPFTTGEWHSLSLDLDFAAQTFSGAVNGQSLGTLSFSGSSSSATYVSLFSMLNFLSPTSGEQQIYFDNLKITAVPEPATTALWAAVTLVGFGAVRRAVRVRR